MSPTQSQAELFGQLREQVGFLDRSCRDYDAGRRDEYKRMSVPLRVLLHDTATSRQHSLLSLLRLKDTLGFYDTAHDPDPSSVIAEFGLVMMAVARGGQCRFEAPL